MIVLSETLGEYSGYVPYVESLLSTLRHGVSIVGYVPCVESLLSTLRYWVRLVCTLCRESVEHTETWGEYSETDMYLV